MRFAVCYHFAIKTGIFKLKTLCLCGFTLLSILFPLAPCKSILNTFVYEIYQRVSILFELSVKHTLSDFLLPFRCHKGLSNSKKTCFTGFFKCANLLKLFSRLSIFTLSFLLLITFIFNGRKCIYINILSIEQYFL